ncbi:MAG: phosphate--AMP phosphotransferase, partial [Bacillota bacterium]|nr:phosphate--AMP phosphotransferase [Bacillota bacterium]
MEKTELKELTKKYRDDIAARLQEIKASKIPFIIMVDGWNTAGKGFLINELIKSIDPRFFQVFVDKNDDEYSRYPFLYKYYLNIPEDGTFRFFDGTYMTDTISDCFAGKLAVDEYTARLHSINNFERTLTNNGYVILKLFLNISEKEQAKRLGVLGSKNNTAWRIKKSDRAQNANYKEWKRAFESFMSDTNTASMWHVIDSEKNSQLKYEAFKLLYETIDNALKAGKFCGAPYK